MLRTPTPLPERNTSSAPRSRSSETNISRARIFARAAISRTALRVIPGSAPSYIGGVWRGPPARNDGNPREALDDAVGFDDLPRALTKVLESPWWFDT